MCEPTGPRPCIQVIGILPPPHTMSRSHAEGGACVCVGDENLVTDVIKSSTSTLCDVQEDLIVVTYRKVKSSNIMKQKYSHIYPLAILIISIECVYY